MTALSIQPTFPTFTGADGQPLENGYIWIGTANLNPITNPITVYWDAALSAPATQPIRTLGGYPSNSGTPARMYVNSDYSIQVLDRKGSVVYSAPVATERYGGGIINAADVVYDPAGTGAVATTVQAKSRERISVLDFGAVSGGSAAVNDIAFAAAISAVAITGQKLYVPAGTYKLNTVLASTGDLILEGDGDSTMLDFGGTVVGASGIALSVTGSLAALPALSTNLSADSNTATFGSAPSLSTGDVFVVYNPTDYSYSGFRAYYHAGEFFTVMSVTGSAVGLTTQSYDSYVAANVNLYKLTSPTVVLRNFRIIGTTVTSLITLSLCKDALIENVSGYLENDSVVSFDRCYNSQAVNLNLYNKGDGGDDYGLSLSNSQNISVVGGNFYGRRHAITTGGSNAVGSVPCRNLRISDATLSNDINSGVWSADFHGNTEDSVYHGCRIYGGASWQGKDNRYVDCVIGDNYTYQCISAAEIKGGYFSLENCTLLSSGDPSANSRGIVDIGGNSTTTVNANTVERAVFSILNCKLSAPAASAITSVMVFRNSGCAQHTNFKIDGLTALGITTFGQVLFTAVDSGTASSEFIIVDGITAFPNGTKLHNPNGASYTNFPHKCQKQTGRVSLTATSGTAETISAPITLKYAYPRIPATFAVSGGASAQTYIGNRPAVANLYQASATSIRPQITSADLTNWSATATVEVSWMASIDEV